MPKVIDRIKNHIEESKKSGKLKPGDKLPPYRELTEMFNGSVQTIRTALVKLEKEGLVETANGIGCFVGGQKPLSVAIIDFPKTTIEAHKFQKLFNNYINKKHLHIKIKVFPYGTESYEELDDYQAVISIRKKTLKKTLCDFKEFVDYDSAITEIQNFPYCSSSCSIPFFYFTHHAGIHKEIFEIIGMDPQEFSSDFEWWTKYATLCKKHDIAAALILWPENKLYMFKTLLNIFLTLKIYYQKSSNIDSDFFQKPMFNSPAGEKILQIIDSCELTPDSSAFYKDNVGIDFNIGSWVTVSNPNRENINFENLHIIPYKYANQKISVVSPECLYLYLSNNVNNEEKERLWKLIKTMISYDFQKDFCALSGAISVRKDFLKKDYSWSKNEDMTKAFLPSPDDILIPEDIISQSYTALLTTAIELYKQKTISAEETLILMDKKFKMEV